MQRQVRVLCLNDNDNRESTLYRLQNGMTLRFTLSTALAAHDVRLTTNHPREHEQFDRNVFHELEWNSTGASRHDNFDRFAEIQCSRPGSFRYCYYANGNRNDLTGSGYVVVDPELRVGVDDGQLLPLDCIQCQTVLSKCLGPFREWRQRLQVACECGYNMIHFTPIQQLSGESDSSYSIRNHQVVNPLFAVAASAGSSTPASASALASASAEWRRVKEFVAEMKRDWNVMSITDLVLNHIANDSPFFEKCPQAGYNLVNSPHLKPAFILDRVLWYFTLQVAGGNYMARGIPPSITDECHLSDARYYLLNDLLPQYKIEEFYQMNVDAILGEFVKRASASVASDEHTGSQPIQLGIIQDPQYRRVQCTVDMELVLNKFNRKIPGLESEEQRIGQQKERLRHELNCLNGQKRDEINHHLQCAIDACIASARRHFLDPDGPEFDMVTAETPFVWNYFYHKFPDTSVEEDEALMNDPDRAVFIMAHNGWVMDYDPLRNFADPDSNVFIRRELTVWGDSCKLRYGDKPDDCPPLWNYMLEYTLQTADLFDGVRLDNCHSTPMHVAEYFIDAARRVKPHLYVIAELFTCSEEKDNMFVNRLGINSLIRETMSAHDFHEEGRLVRRYGGDPVGAFLLPPVRPLTPSMAHALVFDMTHDSCSSIEVRSVLDVLPSCAVISMACCAIGSNRGLDELVPHHIHVAEESRKYPSWSSKSGPQSEGRTNEETGIVAVRRVFNRLHYELGRAGFSQVLVDKLGKETIIVTRHSPVSHQSVVLVARTGFQMLGDFDSNSHLGQLQIEGIVEEILFETCLNPTDDSQSFVRHPTFLNGLSDFGLELRENPYLADSKFVDLHWEKNRTEIEFLHFPPGSVIAFKINLAAPARAASLALRRSCVQLGLRTRSLSGNDIQPEKPKDLKSIVARLSLADLNKVLYCCGSEEHDENPGFGCYEIPQYGKLVYCGLQGIMSVLENIRASNDLGHPLCDNLRQGPWLPQYIGNRLISQHGTRDLGRWILVAVEQLDHLPRYLVPCYFDALVTGAYSMLIDLARQHMSPFVCDGSSFVHALALGSVQMCGVLRSAPLPSLSPHLEPPLPPVLINGETSKKLQYCVTIAAGLPHFSSGIMRSWGRDTFISMRGLMLVTGRFDEARFILLAYGGCLRHGLIPNLLGAGTTARFNCRDAVWWWLRSIQEYCVLKGNTHGTKLLMDPVSRLYPDDDSPPLRPGACDQPLETVMQEALQRHFEGVQFRERCAGPDVDVNMTDLGFNNSVGVDEQTGFVFGGNSHNCGTWMDNMGSSEKAGNRGVPATPRDGSAVELVGLCKAVVTWLGQLYANGSYSFAGVRKTIGDGQVVEWTWSDWASKIQANFETHFWIDSSPDGAGHPDPNPKMINRRDIYKDTVGSSHVWSDYQLRPNFVIAMVVAPELFTPERAWKALAIVEKELLGPLGLKTLDPSDLNYGGDYQNSDDSSDYKRAKGFNYHQGPEWLWPVGFFLRAKLIFACRIGDEKIFNNTVHFVQRALARHYDALKASPWKGLPELTNSNGSFSNDSCPTQAWSISCIMDALFDLSQMA